MVSSDYATKRVKHAVNHFFIFDTVVNIYSTVNSLAPHYTLITVYVKNSWGFGIFIGKRQRIRV